jgi:halimadienyl-diphosphate synthase
VSYTPATKGRAENVASLLSEMRSDAHGEFSPSVYETARLVRFAPSLRGHARRVRYLLDAQRDDGWGGPDEYGLVPTLSATAALLAVLDDPAGGTGDGEVMGAVDRGLRVLFEPRTGKAARLPDTVAVELLVPGLLAEIDGRLDGNLPPGLAAWRDRRLPRPGPAHRAAENGQLLDGLRAALLGGHALPAKLAHTLEVFGDAALGARFTEPTAGGIGCSPAATAAWLGDGAVRAGSHPCVRYLDEVQDRGGGPVPVAAPLPVFERAWVLSTLAGVGLVRHSPDDLVRDLHAAFGEIGVAGGAGLPPDADDTATTLTALARLGSPRSPECLLAYRQRDGHFTCFFDERTPSTSTNAHVLQAFGASVVREEYRPVMAGVADWLCDRQEPDGSWSDKWHASPYYATACCVLALADHGGERAAGALRGAVGWVLDTQRPDGSWGRWAGTFEETAYAVQILCRCRALGGVPDDAVDRAIAGGYARLLRADPDEPHPPLWHDKDLYTPLRIVRAEGMAARYLAAGGPGRERG